jgi:hypothetical protein
MMRDGDEIGPVNNSDEKAGNKEKGQNPENMKRQNLLNILMEVMNSPNTKE